MGTTSVRANKVSAAREFTGLWTGTTTAEIDVIGHCPVGVGVPAAFAGSSLTFQVEIGGSYVVLIDPSTGNAYTVAAAASKYVPINLSYFAGIDKLKVVSDASETGRSAIVRCRPLGKEG